MDAVDELCDNKVNDLQQLLTLGPNKELKGKHVTMHQTNRSTTEGRWLIATPTSIAEHVRKNIDDVFQQYFPKMVSLNNAKTGPDFYMEGQLPRHADRAKPPSHLAHRFAELTATFGSNPQSAEAIDASHNAPKKCRTNNNATFVEVASTHTTLTANGSQSTITTTATTREQDMQTLKSELEKMMNDKVAAATATAAKTMTTSNSETAEDIKKIVHTAVATEMGKVRVETTKLVKEATKTIETHAKAHQREQNQTFKDMLKAAENSHRQ